MSPAIKMQSTVWVAEPKWQFVLVGYPHYRAAAIHELIRHPPSCAARSNERARSPAPDRRRRAGTPVGDALHFLWWLQRGYRHGARNSRGAGRAYSTILAVMWWLLIPVNVAAQAYLLRRRTARYYVSPAHDAVLAIVATAKGWHVEDHVAAWPGTGRGKALRALVLPELRKAADTAGIGIYTTAANERLAAEYSAELPDLLGVGRGWPRGRKLRRDPQPATDCNVGP